MTPITQNPPTEETIQSFLDSVGDACRANNLSALTNQPIDPAQQAFRQDFFKSLMQWIVDNMLIATVTPDGPAPDVWSGGGRDVSSGSLRPN